MSPAAGAGILLLAWSLTGCYSRESYLVAPSEIERVKRLGENERRDAVVPALREESGKPVFVLASALRFDEARPAKEERVRVPSLAFSRMITAGSVLTWVGTGLSLLGTALFAAYGFDPGSRGGLASASVALSGEAPMIVGTILWILGGSTHRPEEVPSGSPAPLRTAWSF